MALKPCRECGQQVSSQAKTCPHCGIKGPVPSKVGLLFGGVVILGIVMAILAPSDTVPEPAPSAPAPAPPDLSASVSFDGTQFVIRNGDGFDWTNCELDLNGGMIRSGYVLSAGRVAAGETYSVGSMQFANGDGERFNPYTMKPQGMAIRCDTPRGRAYYAGSWE